MSRFRILPTALVLILSLVFGVFSFIGALSALPVAGKPDSDISAYLSNSAKIKEISLPKKQSDSSFLPIEYDFESYVFRVLTSEAAHSKIGNSNILSEELYGDILGATAFTRTSAVAERLNIEVQEIISEHIGIDMKKSVLSGSDDYDLLSLNTNKEMALQLQVGVLADLKQIQTLNLDKPWYDSSCIRDLEIADKLYLLTGDIIAGNNDSVSLMVYNRDLASEIGYINQDGFLFEEYVSLGDWTLDTLNSIILQMNESFLDEDSEISEYGAFYIGGLDTFSLCFGAGASSFVKGEDGIPLINLNSDNFLSIFKKVLSIQLLPEASSEISADSFIGGLTLFDTATVKELKALSESGINIGILPIPKLNPEQQQYRSVVDFKDTVSIAIPSSNKNLTRTGIIIEQLSSESHWYMWDSYYDSILRNDEGAKKMMKTILASKMYDIGELFGWADISKTLNDLTSSNGLEDFALQMERRANAARFAMDLILKEIARTEQVQN